MAKAKASGRGFTGDEIRKDLVDRALEDWSSLHKLLQSLTEPEVLHALQFEHSSRRRATITNRLIRRATRLAELRTHKMLTERFAC